MYRVIKVLNNNSVLVLHEARKKEYILMGNGIGFGKRPGQRLEGVGDSRVYALVTKKKQQSALKAVNGIEPVYIEATAKIIDIAESVFKNVNRDILLPLADHIALAAKRAKENSQIPNPFTSDIRLLFPEAFEVAKKGKTVLKAMTGYELSDDEAGFIALHIHAGLEGGRVSDTLDATRIADESICMLERYFETSLEKDSLEYHRLLSHLYDMIARIQKGEPVNVDLNDFVRERYPEAAKAASQVCAYMEAQLGKAVLKDEMGFLAIHIQRVIKHYKGEMKDENI